MTYETTLALGAFALVMSITPGPNNLMLLASGANFGWSRTVPHMLGVSFGFLVLTLLAGSGLNQLFQAYPVTHTVLKFLSVAFMLYLAYKIATAAPPPSGEAPRAGTPMTFVQAALFQWINPKAIAMAVSAVSAYAPPSHGFWGVALVAVIFSAINLPTINIWTMLGTQLRRILDVAWKLRMFNITAALLLIATLYPILFP